MHARPLLLLLVGAGGGEEMVPCFDTVGKGGMKLFPGKTSGQSKGGPKEQTHKSVPDLMQALFTNTVLYNHRGMAKVLRW